MVVYHLLYKLLVFFSVWVGGLVWWLGRGESRKRRVHNSVIMRGGVMVISTVQLHSSPDGHM
jgi:hypothetical protein